jgi:hypothetical protein
VSRDAARLAALLRRLARLLLGRTVSEFMRRPSAVISAHRAAHADVLPLLGTERTLTDERDASR